MRQNLFRLIAVAVCFVAIPLVSGQTGTSGGTTGNSQSTGTQTSGQTGSSVGKGTGQSGTGGSSAGQTGNPSAAGVRPGVGTNITPVPGASATVSPLPNNDPLSPTYSQPGASASVTPTPSISPTPSVHP
jgi:hypothetical protein